MEQPYSSGLRTTFLVHGIVGLIFGLGYLLIPETVGGLTNWEMGDPAYRTLGAAILGFTASSWLALRQTERSKVKIVVQAEIVWTVLGALVSAWSVLAAAAPPFAWVNAAILAAFAVAFAVFYPAQ
jgi:hypothetical protein